MCAGMAVVLGTGNSRKGCESEKQPRAWTDRVAGYPCLVQETITGSHRSFTMSTKTLSLSLIIVSYSHGNTSGLILPPLALARSRK